MTTKLFPPGLLALSTSETSRFSASNASREGLLRPKGSCVYPVYGLSIAENFNQAARTLLSRPELQWMFLMNDDHIYPPDTLLRLLAHEVDAVTGLYCERTVPFGPVLFDRVLDDDGRVGRIEWTSEPITSELKPIVACGDGCMLVARSVFELVDQPWWTYGEIERDRSDHDLAFCKHLREAGIQIWADLSVVVDHQTPASIRPFQNPDGSWSAKLTFRGTQSFDVLIASKPVEEPASV